MRYHRCGGMKYKLCLMLRKAGERVEIEQVLISGLMGLGTQTVGFLFLYFFMKHHFRREEQHDERDTHIIDKLDDLAEKVTALSHLDKEITQQTALLQAISDAVLLLAKELHFVNTAVKKGYMNETQAHEVISE